MTLFLNKLRVGKYEGKNILSQSTKLKNYIMSVWYK